MVRIEVRRMLVVMAIGCLGSTGEALAQADTTPPETTITIGPAEGETINSDAPQFGWASSEAGSTFACTADGVALASCNDAYLTGTPPGRHTFTVAATDPAGNTDPTPAVRNFSTILTGAPPNQPGCPLDGSLVFGTSGADARTGGAGTDLMFGFSGADVLRGAGGADCISGQGNGDRVLGGSGGDYLFGGTGNDRVSGEAGGDRVYGDAGSDRVSGGSGNDFLYGGSGNDRLSDATGRDTFSGGPGNDNVNARDTSFFARGTPDVVRCGTGRFDVAVVDRRDRVSRDCERVRRR